MNKASNKPRATAPYYIGSERNSVGTTLRDTVNAAIDNLELPSWENAKKAFDSLVPDHMRVEYRISLISAPERS